MHCWPAKSLVLTELCLCVPSYDNGMNILFPVTLWVGKCKCDTLLFTCITIMLCRIQTNKSMQCLFVQPLVLLVSCSW